MYELLIIILASGVFTDSASDNVDSFFFEIGRYIQSFFGSVDTSGNPEDVNAVVDSSVETAIAGKNFFIKFHEAIVNLVLLITNRTNADIDYNTVIILSMVITGLLVGIGAWRLAKESGTVLILMLIIIFVIWGWGISTVFQI